MDLSSRRRNNNREDTLYGITDFIINDKYAGWGVILYPISHNSKIKNEEYIRSYIDINLLGILKNIHKLHFGWMVHIL